MKRYYSSLDTNLHFLADKYNIISLDDLFNLFLKCWTKDTCTVRLKYKWEENNPTVGQCSITAFLFQDLFGGDVYGLPLDGGGVHCFNVIDDIVIDLTVEQFECYSLNYTLEHKQIREEHFNDKDKYNRYLLLKSNFFEIYNIAKRNF